MYLFILLIYRKLKMMVLTDLIFGSQLEIRLIQILCESEQRQSLRLFRRSLFVMNIHELCSRMYSCAVVSLSPSSMYSLSPGSSYSPPSGSLTSDTAFLSLCRAETFLTSRPNRRSILIFRGIAVSRCISRDWDS